MGDVQVGPATRLSPADVQNLWTANGGDPDKALLATAVVFGAENPPGNAGLVNDTPETGDYSVGLWQINYYGGLESVQTARFGPADALAADPDLQARAAIAMSQNGQNWAPWGPDFGYPGYGQKVPGPLPGSKVGNWLAAHGGASASGSSSSLLASLQGLPWPAIAGAAGILAVAGVGAWILLTPENRVPAGLRRFALPNPIEAEDDDADRAIHGHRDLEPMVVQSLLFPLDKYNVPTAQRWARGHGYKTSQVELTSRYIHLVQMSPKGFGVIRTIPMGGSGIKAHVARERAA